MEALVQTGQHWICNKFPAWVHVFNVDFMCQPRTGLMGGGGLRFEVWGVGFYWSRTLDSGRAAWPRGGIKNVLFSRMQKGGGDFE